jgi:hypothetical protein
MWKLLQRFRALDRHAQSAFLGASLLLPLIAASLRLRGFRTTQAALAHFLSVRKHSHRHADETMAIDAARTARMVGAAVRYSFVRPACLEKSLVLWWLLRRQGIASSVRVGTRKNAGGLEAHAWVEYCGSALNEIDRPHEHYAAFDAFPELSPK